MENPITLQRVAVACPSGNTTAVVFDQLLNLDREQLNAQIMEAWQRRGGGEPQIEQCCFVMPPKDQRAVARVEMFGGEFCGNATRSVIQLVTEGRDCRGMVEASGVDRPLNFNVNDGSIAVEMPLPLTGELVREVAEGILVQLDGIAQLVVIKTPEERHDTRTPRELLKDLLSQKQYGLDAQPAAGVTYYDPKSKNAEFAISVKEVNTVFDETACGSGTSAIGIASAVREQKNQRLEVIQPSGETIVTEAEFDSEAGKVVASTIAGQVSVLYDGDLVLS